MKVVMGGRGGDNNGDHLDTDGVVGDLRSAMVSARTPACDAGLVVLHASIYIYTAKPRLSGLEIPMCMYA